MASIRGSRLSLGAEVALAFAAGIAAFAVVSLAVVVANADGFVVLTIALCAAGVAAVVRYWGVAYAVPAALAAALAFDWFYIPPTHPHEFPDAESLADLLALIAVGVLVGELAANATRRAEVSERARSELADDQAALRRVATLVAEGVDAPELMTAVAREAGILLDVDGAWIEYYDGDEVVTAAQWSRGGKQPPTFERVRVDEAPVAAAVRRSGSVVRVDDFEDIQPRMAPAGAPRVMSLVGAPITVEGRQWGLMLAWSRDAPLPEEAEAHLTDFTELVATAIANSEARAETRRLADEQAALRRVATLVAEGMPPLEVFGAVSREVGLLLDVDGTHMARFESDGSAVNVASWSRDGRHLPVGTVVPVHGASVTGLIHESGRPERMESYEGAPPEIAEMVRELGVTSAVGAPIVVEGQLWGVMVAATKHQATLPAGTESRIMRFTELVATSISNTQSRDQTRRLADEQAALRRVATVAVESASPSELFEAVVGEVGALFGADVAGLLHYTDEDTAELVATWTADGVPLDAPRTWSMTEMGLPRTTPAADWPTRVDDWSQMPGALAAYVQEVGVTSSVGSPIVVGGQLWGALAVHSRGDPVPAGTELRLGQFTALAATAISSVQARRDLAASRARIVAAADDERRRVVRDLHDGAQQRLVHTVVTLRMARSALDAEERHDAAGLVAEALQHSEEATSELRELAHGIMPSVLARGGLQAGVAALASRMPLPVKTEVSVDRLPPDVEATAYFVIAEALTNVAKHAGADNAEVIARLEKGELRVHVSDDGVGGAKQDGSGLVGLGDRVAALQGTLRVESPADGGTRIVAAIPVR